MLLRNSIFYCKHILCNYLYTLDIVKAPVRIITSDKDCPITNRELQPKSIKILTSVIK